MGTSASNAIAEAQKIVQAGALPPFVVAPRHQSTIGLHLPGRWDRKSSGWHKRLGCLRRPAASHPAPPATPTNPEPPSGGEEPPGPPESEPPATPRPWPALDRLGLDGLGLTQAIGGLALGLIALFSSYDYITFAGRTLQLNQQWGIPFIAASVATVVVEFLQYCAPLGRDAELASRSRRRVARDAGRAARDAVGATQDAARMADATARERHLASEERQRADRERDRAAEARERQGESLQRHNQAALRSARIQLDPSASNRARLHTFLSLIGGIGRPEEDNL